MSDPPFQHLEGIAKGIQCVGRDQDGLLALFDAKDTGGDYQLVPANDDDMRGKFAKPKATLEVIYDDA